MSEKEREAIQTRAQAQNQNEPVQNVIGYPRQIPNYNTIYTGANAVPGPAFNPKLSQDANRILLADTTKKSLVESYLLWLVFGLLGAHHFYLRRTEWGILYFLTGGLMGCGWLIDLFRMPYLVSQVNNRSQDENSVKRKNISDTYTLWFPFGLLGFHHFYLENALLGGLYFITGGLFGIGWLVDLVRIPSLVKAANLKDTSIKEEKTVGTAIVLGVPPLGVLGFHHFYLNRPLWGFMYILTAGLGGIGWLVDWFRIPVLVKRVNKQMHLGIEIDRHLDDAYLLWFPFGLLGFHQFYLRRPVWGTVYLMTGGFFGIGWIVDGFRMHCLVKDCNRLERERIERLPVYQVPYSGTVVTSATNPRHPQGGAAPSYNPSYQAPVYTAEPSSGFQYPPQTGYQQTAGTSHAPSYVEQPPPYSYPARSHPVVSGTGNKVTHE